MKNILIVTHPDCRKDQPNPGLTSKGNKQIKKMKAEKMTTRKDISILPCHPRRILCGVGKRHIETLKALELTSPRIDYSRTMVDPR